MPLIIEGLTTTCPRCDGFLHMTRSLNAAGRCGRCGTRFFFLSAPYRTSFPDLQADPQLPFPEAEQPLQEIHRCQS